LMPAHAGQSHSLTRVGGDNPVADRGPQDSPYVIEPGLDGAWGESRRLSRAAGNGPHRLDPLLDVGAAERSHLYAGECHRPGGQLHGAERPALPYLAARPFGEVRGERDTACGRVDVGARDDARGHLIQPPLCIHLPVEVTSVLLAGIIAV